MHGMKNIKFISDSIFLSFSELFNKSVRIPGSKVTSPSSACCLTGIHSSLPVEFFWAAKLAKFSIEPKVINLDSS